MKWGKLVLVVLVGALLVLCGRGRAPFRASRGDPEREQYARQVQDIREDYFFFTAYLRIQVSTALENWEKESWRAKVETALLGWEVSGKRLRQLNPPQGCEALHSRLVALSYRYDRCTGFVRKAFALDGPVPSEVDLRALEQATEEAIKIREIWWELEPQLERLFETKSVGDAGITESKAPRRYIVVPEVWHGCRDSKCFEVRLVHNDATLFLEPGPCPIINPCPIGEVHVNDDF